MKRCPSCNSTYADNSLSFCLTDGTPLVSETADSYDPARTLVSPTRAPTSSPLPPPQVAGVEQTPSYQQPYQQWGAPPASRSGNKKIILAVVGLLLLAGVGLGIYFLTRSSAPSTPTEVWKAFYAAAQKSDVAAMKKLMSKDLLAVAQKDAHDRPIDDFISSQVGDEIRNKATSETRNEQITGDHATVEVKGAQEDEWNPIPFVKEDGSWKLNPR